MTHFRSAQARGVTWQVAAQACLEPLKGAKATLGFIYVTDTIAQHLESIVSLFRAETGVEHWVGSVGVGVCANGHEYFGEPAVVALIGDFPPQSFNVFSAVTGVESAAAVDLSCGTESPNFAIIHADPRTERMERIVPALAKRFDSGFLVGGLVSSATASLQVADRVFEGGVSGVAFSEEVIIATRLTQGCRPIGPVHTITACQHNVLVSLDGRAAFDVFLEDIGETVAADLNRVGGHIFAGLSVKGSDTDDYLVRNLVGIDTESKLIAIGDYVKKGEQVRFCRRDRKSAQDDMSVMLDSIKQGLYAPPSAGVYFSCLGRGETLFGQGQGEMKMIHDVFGDIPLVGFFCNGEISHNRLYGYTGVLTLFI